MTDSGKSDQQVGHASSAQQCPAVHTEGPLPPGFFQDEIHPLEISHGQGTQEKLSTTPPPIQELPAVSDIEAAFWTTYNKEAGAFDREKLDAWNKSLDVHLVFAGLFSAINTAFILESYKGLRPDSSATTNQLLLMLLVHRNDDTPFTEDIMASFSSPDISSVSVNCFYFTSLACSLVAAFGAVNAKQWLLEYASIGSSLSQEALGRRRQAKYDEMNRWHVDVVITALPLILQSSLLLFFIGTTKFLLQINHTVAIIFLVVFLMGFWIYLMSMAVGIASPASPFQTPELELVQTLILKPVITLLGLFRLSSSQPVSVSDPVMDQHSPAAEEHSVIDMMDEDSTATSEDKTTLNCALWMFEQAESRDVALCAASMFCRIRADLLFDRLSHPINRTTLERIIAFHQSTFAIEGTGKPCDAPSWLPSSIVSGLALNHVLSGRRWDRDSLDEILEDYHMWHIYPSNTPLGVISTALAMRLSSTPFWYMSNSLSQLLEAATTSLPLRIAPPVASNPSAPVTSINISPFKTVLHLVIHYAMQAEVDADFMAHTPAFKEISETLHNRATDWMSDDAELTSLVALTIATLNWFGRDKSATPWSYPSDTEQRRFESILWDRYLALDKRKDLATNVVLALSTVDLSKYSSDDVMMDLVAFSDTLNKRNWRHFRTMTLSPTFTLSLLRLARHRIGHLDRNQECHQLLRLLAATWPSLTPFTLDSNEFGTTASSLLSVWCHSLQEHQDRSVSALGTFLVDATNFASPETTTALVTLIKPHLLLESRWTPVNELAQSIILTRMGRSNIPPGERFDLLDTLSLWISPPEQPFPLHLFISLALTLHSRSKWSYQLARATFMLRFFNRLMLEDDTLRWSPYFKDMGFQGGESQLEESDATIISGAYERQYQMTEPMVARDNITFAWIGESTILLWRIVQAARTGGVVPEDWDAEPLFSKHLEMGIVDYFEFMQASGRSLGPIQKQCLPNYFEQALRSDPNAEEYRFETESHPRLAWVHALLEALRRDPS